MAEPFWQKDLDRSKGLTAPVQRKSNAQIESTEAGTATTTAKLPYVAPGAAADVKKTEQNVQFNPLEQSRAELKAFEDLKPVQKYTISLPLLDAALKSGDTSADDSDLIMLASKLQDPEGSVREGDEARYTRIQVALDYIPQEFKRQFERDGRFTPQTRDEIRRYLIRRVNSYRQSYMIERNRFIDRVSRSNERGEISIDPLDVVGPDPGLIFKPSFDIYEKAAKDRGAPPKSKDEDAIGLFETPPEGAQIAGEKVKGMRFSNEAAITAVARDPKATPADLARIITDTAVAEGHATLEQAEGMYAANLATATDYFGKFKTPEDRAKIPEGIDYSNIDKAAAENAGVLESAAQAGRNLPESGAQLIQGVTAPIGDAALSIASGQRHGVYKTLPDLGADIVGLGSGDTLDATMKMLNERYGGGQELKQTLTTDPIGSLADLSMLLTGGGSALARAPGAIGRFGEGARTLGRMTDPLTGARAIVERGIPAALGPTGAVARTPFALSSGVPGESIRQAGRLGFERGSLGVTPRTRAFEENLRGVGDPQAIIDAARASVTEMRNRASQAYRSGMIDVSRDATILDLAPIDQVLSDLRDRAYHHGTVKDPRAAQIHQRVSDIVDEWRNADPATHRTPEGMDALKQRIGDVVDDFKTGNDRRAASIAQGVYNSVRKAVADQVPTYAATMSAYEDAAKVTREIEKTFSLNPTASIDTQIRKLQSLTRNNAYTGYGQRQRLGELMERYGGETIIPGVTGAALNSPQPRGLQGILGGTTSLVGGLLTGTGTGGLLGPAALLGGIPATIPRVVGETTYALGRGAGMAARGARAAFGYGPRKLLDLQERYPGVTLAQGQLGSRAQEAELYERDAARTPEPPITLDLNEVPHRPVAVPDEVTVGAQTEPGVDAVLGPDEHIDPATDEIVNDRTGERRPSRAYARGGPVREGDPMSTVREGDRGTSREGDPLTAVRRGDRIVWVPDPRSAVREGDVDRRFYDPRSSVREGDVTQRYYDPATAVRLGDMARRYAGGGGVSAWMPSWANVRDAGRSAARGATFAWNDELEAIGAALANGDITMDTYRDRVNRIRAQQNAFTEKHPYISSGFEMAGAIAPSVIMRKPAASIEQGLAKLAGRVPGVAGVALRRPKLATSIVGAGPEVAMSMLYGAGDAPTVGEILPYIASDMETSLPMYLGGEYAGHQIGRGWKAARRGLGF